MSIAAQMPHSEHGLTVNLPTPWFQFEGSDFYKTFHQTVNFKEMDFGFLQEDAQTLWLLELKDFNHPTYPVSIQDAGKGNKKDWLDELLKCAVHACIMVLLSLRYSKPSIINLNNNSIRVVHIINVQESEEHYLNAWDLSIQSRFKPFMEDYSIKSINIMSYRKAKSLFSWVV